MSLIGRDICVVGGGIAGLAVARALALRGAAVTVLEQADAISEVGAGLQISPNGGRVVQALGLGSAFEAVSLESRAVVLRNARGAEVLRMDLAGRGRFGLVHRADLIEVLRAGAVAAGVAIETGMRVAAARPGAAHPTLTMEDGTERRTSLIVGADGLHSRVRAALLAEAAPAFTGQTAWRALVPATERMPVEAQVFMGPGRHLVAYPLREGRLVNLVAVQERAAWAEEGWHVEGDVTALRAAFTGFGGQVQDWLARVERCNLWGLFRHPVASRWHTAGAVLLGDAAHPTLPFLAQGACMALEDAWVLARCLAEYEGDAAALAAYQSARRARVVRIVDAATANARNYHLSGPAQTVAHAGLHAINRVAPGLMLRRFDWLYGHDPTA